MPRRLVVDTLPRTPSKVGQCFSRVSTGEGGGWPVSTLLAMLLSAK